MALSEAKKQAIARYHKKLDDIKIRAPKGFREEVAKHAKARGESKAAFIVRAIRETMERDNQDK